MLSPELQEYQRSVDGPPSLLALAGVLRTHGLDPIANLKRLLAVTTLHVAVGNTDAHARNHAFLHRDGGVTLTPLYDAAPTWRSVSTRMIQETLDRLRTALVQAANETPEVDGEIVDDCAARTVALLGQSEA